MQLLLSPACLLLACWVFAMPVAAPPTAGGALAPSTAAGLAGLWPSGCSPVSSDFGLNLGNTAGLNYRTAAITQGQANRLCYTGRPRLPLLEASIESVQAAMLDGEASCSQVVGEYLQRITAYDQATQLNSIRVLDPALAAVVAARDVQLQRIQNGTDEMPPLFCVPLLLKDNIDALGMASTAGASALLDNLPNAEGHLVTSLRNAGAVIMGKGNMGEFAFDPDQSAGSAYGIVRNPYGLDYSTAGSSGGPAAATSANLVLAAIGTDTGNSIRGPSSHCGVVGLRPSLGLVSRSGVVPGRLNRDTCGPIGRSVEDVARLLEVIAGHDPADPLTVAARLWELHLVKDAMQGMESCLGVPRNYTAYLRTTALAGARIGIVDTIVYQPVADSGVQLMFESAVAHVQAAGASIMRNFTINGNIYGADWNANRNGQGPNYGFWNVRGVWQDMWGCIGAFTNDLGTYLANASAPLRFRSVQSIVAAGAYHPSIQNDMLAAANATYAPSQYSAITGQLCGCGTVAQDPCRAEFLRRLVQSMDAAGVDVIAYPTWSFPPQLIGQSGVVPDGNNSPHISPHTGTPSISVPMGLAANGLPTGIQFLARPFQEGPLLGIAFAYEQLSNHRVPPAGFPECSGSPIVTQSISSSG